MRFRPSAVFLLPLLVGAESCAPVVEHHGPSWLWIPVLTATALAMITVLLGALAVYYILLVRAIMEMVQLDANKVLLAFAFVSLVPAGPLILLGIFILIIWSNHKKTFADAL